MDADLERTLLVQASTELTGGGRVMLADLATSTGLDLEEATAAVEQLAANDLVEVEDGAVVRVTDAGLAEIEASG
jgi:Mn-dependent DtxR family transcriptional regulator